MQTGYFSAAWNDIKHSPGWFGKLIILALLQIVPIFGQIVGYGYLYGWARDIAWNVHSPLPKQILGNQDGKLYSRGFFVLVISIVFALIPYVIMFGYMIFAGAFTGGMQTMSPHGSYSSSPTDVFFISAMGIFVYFLCIILFLLAGIFSWVGNMRMSVYGKLAPGLQFGKIWDMMRHDFGGLMRIFGMSLLVGFIIGFVLSMVVFIAMFVLMFIAIGSGAASGAMNPGFSGNSAAVTASLLMGPLGIVMMLLYVVIVVIALASGMFMQMLVTRALGYWTRNFDVAAWGGSKEPMPFQIQHAAVAGAGAPVVVGAHPASVGQPVQGTPYTQTSQTAPVSSGAMPVPTVAVQDSSNTAIQDSVQPGSGSAAPDSTQSNSDDKKKEE